MDLDKIVAPRGKKPKDLLSLFFGRITKPKAGEEPLTMPVWKTLLGKGVDPLAFKRWFLKFRPYETIQIGAAYGQPSKIVGKPTSIITGIPMGEMPMPPTLDARLQEYVAGIGPSIYAEPSARPIGGRGIIGGAYEPLYGAGGGPSAERTREEFVYRGGIFIPTIPRK